MFRMQRVCIYRANWLANGRRQLNTAVFSGPWRAVRVPAYLPACMCCLRRIYTSVVHASESASEDKPHGPAPNIFFAVRS